jgi:hypothetical protein
VAEETALALANERTQVFLLRIWHEAQEDGRREVRIQARHVLSGETRYFLAWPALTTYLAGKLDYPSRIPGA